MCGNCPRPAVAPPLWPRASREAGAVRPPGFAATAVSSRPGPVAVDSFFEYEHTNHDIQIKSVGHCVLLPMGRGSLMGGSAGRDFCAVARALCTPWL